MEVSQVDDLQQYIFSAPPAPERSPYHGSSDPPPGGEQPAIRDSVADSVMEGIRRAELLLARDLTGTRPWLCRARGAGLYAPFMTVHG